LTLISNITMHAIIHMQLCNEKCIARQYMIYGYYKYFYILRIFFIIALIIALKNTVFHDNRNR